MDSLAEYRQSLIPKLPPGMTLNQYLLRKEQSEQYNRCHKMALRDLSDARRDTVVLPKLVGVGEFLSLKRKVEWLNKKDNKNDFIPKDSGGYKYE